MWFIEKDVQEIKKPIPKKSNLNEYDKKSLDSSTDSIQTDDDTSLSGTVNNSYVDTEHLPKIILNQQDIFKNLYKENQIDPKIYQQNNSNEIKLSENCESNQIIENKTNTKNDGYKLNNEFLNEKEINLRNSDNDKKIKPKPRKMRTNLVNNVEIIEDKILTIGNFDDRKKIVPKPRKMSGKNEQIIEILDNKKEIIINENLQSFDNQTFNPELIDENQIDERFENNIEILNKKDEIFTLNLHPVSNRKFYETDV